MLFNIARGGLIDEPALAKALREQKIAAAGLDVFEGEPAVNAGLFGITQHCDDSPYSRRHVEAHMDWPSWGQKTLSRLLAWDLMPAIRPRSSIRKC